MRRKRGVLLPIELSILDAALELRLRAHEEFYGFLIARHIAETRESRLLTAHGTLYRALERMAGSGLLASHWEDPGVAALEKRPRRRFYKVTAAGESAAKRRYLELPAVLREGRAQL